MIEFIYWFSDASKILRDNSARSKLLRQWVQLLHSYACRWHFFDAGTLSNRKTPTPTIQTPWKRPPSSTSLPSNTSSRRLSSRKEPPIENQSTLTVCCMKRINLSFVLFQRKTNFFLSIFVVLFLASLVVLTAFTLVLAFVPIPWLRNLMKVDLLLL